MLYYARSVDPTMLQGINEISQVQPKSTNNSKEKAKMLLDSAATYQNAVIHYKDRNMFLHVDSDAAYLTMTEAKVFYAGHFYLSDWT